MPGRRTVEEKNRGNAVGSMSKFVLAGAMALFAASTAPPAKAAAAPAPCTADGKIGFICGLNDVEDLVLVPGTRWIIGSSYQLGAAAPKSGGLYAIDTKAKTAKTAAMTLGPADKAYAGCAPPTLAGLNTHGLDLRPGSGGQHTLYVLNHGGRESIEIFRVDAKGAEPKLTWTGCVVLPDGVNGNSVAALPKGAFAVTKFQDSADKQGIVHILNGDVTGAVLIWTPGAGFSELKGARLAGNNGMIASPDGKYLFVNAYGGKAIWRFAVDGSEPAKSAPMAFRPDNLRWAPDGKILATGQFIEPATLRTPLHGWAVVRLDPKTMATTPVLQQPGRPSFDDGTVALQVGDTLWVGTFRGDRIVYAPMK